MLIPKIKQTKTKCFTCRKICMKQNYGIVIEAKKEKTTRHKLCNKCFNKEYVRFFKD